MPVGPRHHSSRLAPLAQPDNAIVSACDSAEVLLSLVTLDPAVGGERLATWASDVVVVVTAGQSSAMRIRAVGEMVRLAGADSVSAVVIGADKDDESLGVTARAQGTRYVGTIRRPRPMTSSVEVRSPSQENTTHPRYRIPPANSRSQRPEPRAPVREHGGQLTWLVVTGR